MTTTIIIDRPGLTWNAITVGPETTIRAQIRAEHARRDALAAQVVAGATVTVAVQTVRGWRVVTGQVDTTYPPDGIGEFYVVNGCRRYIANVRDVTAVH